MLYKDAHIGRKERCTILYLNYMIPTYRPAGPK